MQNVNVLAQTFQDSGSTSAPGSTQGPNDGQDNVAAATVLESMQDGVNTDAYLAALGLGAYSAPPYAQPPVIPNTTGTPNIVATGPGSGPSRKQTVTVDSTAQLGTLAAAPLSICNYPGYGEYIYISPHAVTARAASTSYAVGARVFFNGIIWINQTGGPSSTGSTATLDANIVAGTYIDGSVKWTALTAALNTFQCIISATASAWASGTYSVGQYVLDGSSNIWLCIKPGTSGGSTPFSGSPTPGVTTQADGTGGLLWASVGLYGAWVSTNALYNGFSPTSTLLQFPQPNGVAATDPTGTVPMGELNVVPSVYVTDAIYKPGDRVTSGGDLYVCIRNNVPNVSANAPTGTGTWIGDAGAAGLYWNYVSAANTTGRQLAVAVNGVIPPSELPPGGATTGTAQSGGYSNTTATYTEVTGLSASITPSGMKRPIAIMFSPIVNTNAYWQLAITTNPSGQDNSFQVQAVVSNGDTMSVQKGFPSISGQPNPPVSPTTAMYGPAEMNMIYYPTTTGTAALTFTINARLFTAGASNTISAANLVLTLREML